MAYNTFRNAQRGPEGDSKGEQNISPTSDTNAVGAMQSQVAIAKAKPKAKPKAKSRAKSKANPKAKPSMKK